MGIEKVNLGSLKAGDTILVTRRGTVIDLWRDIDDRGDATPLQFVVDSLTFSGSTPPGRYSKNRPQTGVMPGYTIQGGIRHTRGTYKIGPFHVSSRARKEVEDAKEETPAPSVVVSLDGATGTATLVVEIRVDGPDGRTYVVTAETEGKASVKAE